MAEGRRSLALFTKFGIKASRLFNDLSLYRTQSYLDCDELKFGLIRELDLLLISSFSKEHETRINSIKSEFRFLNKCFQSNSLLK
jgi:hypothetical protein